MHETNEMDGVQTQVRGIVAGEVEGGRLETVWQISGNNANSNGTHLTLFLYRVTLSYGVLGCRYGYNYDLYSKTHTHSYHSEQVIQRVVVFGFVDGDDAGA